MAIFDVVGPSRPCNQFSRHWLTLLVSGFDERRSPPAGRTGILRCQAVYHAPIAPACVIAFEAWSKPLKSGESFDEAESPSEAVDRQEIFALLGESRDYNEHRTFPIIRSGNGKFFGFGPPESPKVNEMKGRFAQLLATKVPDDAMRDLAKAMLKIRGLQRAGADFGSPPK